MIKVFTNSYLDVMLFNIVQVKFTYTFTQVQLPNHIHDSLTIPFNRDELKIITNSKTIIVSKGIN